MAGNDVFRGSKAPEEIFDWNFFAEQMVILWPFRYRPVGFIWPAISKKH